MKRLKHCHFKKKQQPDISAKHVIYSKPANPLGEIGDYGIHIATGSPHAHRVIWVKDAPRYGVDSDEEVCEFIDQAIPKTESKLRDLILLLQQHKHSRLNKDKK